MGLASALLFLGRAQNFAHHIELRRAGILYQFDYFPAGFQWLAALYAPSCLLTFPVAAIPGIPKLSVAIWFVLCVGAFWYWLCIQLETGGGLKRSRASTRRSWGELFNWLGLIFGLTLCLASASAAWQGGSPLVVDTAGFLWGLGLLILFVRNIREMRLKPPLPRSAP